jgi:creatinine amidohydrolase
MDTGDVIRRRRTSLGLSQNGLAEQVCLDKRQIRRYEAGESQPTLASAKALAHALRISIAELAGCEPHPDQGPATGGRVDYVTDLMTTATSRVEAGRHTQLAVLPIGSFEQHGDHLPLITDTIVACVIAREVAEAYDLFLLPPITISCSHEHAAWAGTVSISSTTLIAVIDDIRASLHRSRIEKLVLVNCHGGNYVLRNIVQEASIDGPQMALFPGSDDWGLAREDAGLITSDHDDMHAGELETSILLHSTPELVRPGFRTSDWEVPDRSFLLTHGMARYTRTGTIGRASAASADKGNSLLASLTASFDAVLTNMAE